VTRHAPGRAAPLKRKLTRTPRPLTLYWCSTEDHHEDWFVVARSATEAVRFFESCEGYEDETFAEALTAVPDALQDDQHLGWPSDELLVACGARILRADTPRVVELGGVRYSEGMLEHQILQLTDDQFERRGSGRPNRTVRTRSS